MQKILSLTRKATEEYSMIEQNDSIGVCVSGGKDSVLLLSALIGLRRFIGVEFSITALTLDLQFGGKPLDFSPITNYCDSFCVEHKIRRTNIGEIIFDVRKEKNPCSLCARMRRGALHDLAKECGCNKIALGHHFDDVIETFMMNLFQQGRIGCFSPKSYLSRKDLTMIRPLIYVPEQEVKRVVKSQNLPIVKNPCPADGNSIREETKQMLSKMENKNKGVKQRIFGAICRGEVDGFKKF